MRLLTLKAAQWLKLIVADQAKYHDDNYRKLEQAEARLHLLITLIFFLAIFAVLFIAGYTPLRPTVMGQDGFYLKVPSISLALRLDLAVPVGWKTTRCEAALATGYCATPMAVMAWSRTAYFVPATVPPQTKPAGRHPFRKNVSLLCHLCISVLAALRFSKA